MTYRILFQIGTNKRTCTLQEKPSSIDEIVSLFQDLFTEIHILDALRDNIQYFDPEFEEWVDLVNIEEIPERMVKIRIEIPTGKDVKQIAKNIQKDYSFTRRFDFKSHIESMIQDVERLSLSSDRRLEKQRWENSGRSRSVERPSRSTTPTSRLGDSMSFTRNDTSFSRPRSAGGTRVRRKRHLISEERIENDSNIQSIKESEHLSSIPRSVSTGRRVQVIKKSEDSSQSIDKPTFKVSKKRNYTIPITPMVLQRSIDYREKYLRAIHSKDKKKQSQIKEQLQIEENDTPALLTQTL